MSKSMRLVASAALCFWSTEAALADLTAPDLWNEWQELAALTGGELTAGSEDYAAGVLTLRDVRWGGEAGATVGRLVIDELTFEERADDLIRVTQSPSMTSFTADSASDTTTTTQFTVEGYEMTVRGEGDRRFYTTQTAFFSSEVTSMTVEGEAVPLTSRSSYTGQTGAFEMTVGGVRIPLTGSGQIETVEIVQQFEIDDAQQTVAQRLTDVSATLDGFLDQQMSFWTLGLGFAFDAGVAFEESALRSQFQTDEGQFELAAITGPGETALGFSPQSFTLSQTARDADVQLLMRGLPFPLEGSMETLTVGLTLPLSTTQDTPGEMALTIAARELQLSDVIWGLFDAGGAIPRDPINLVVDLAGEATVLLDVFGPPETLEDFSGPPGELESARIRELLLEVGGARLTGAGAVAFEPGPDGLPSPVGTLSLELAGGFALLDALAAARLIPAEQVSVARAMAGMFARPVGEDVLSSNVEFLSGGGILVNGLPLQ